MKLNLSSRKQNARGELWWLLFWPIYLTRYVLIEQLNPAAVYTPIHCPLDDAIPFSEWFLIPYISWYALIVGMHLYTAMEDREQYLRYSRFLVIAMSVSSGMFLLFPSCQNLRPEAFPRDNWLTEGVKLLYAVDTSTNVFPSEHVIASLGAMAAGLGCKKLGRIGKCFLVFWAVMICLSTVFLKQHSLLDGLAAVPVCLLAWYLAGK